MSLYIGVDPGAKGAICALNHSLNEIHFIDTKYHSKVIFDWICWIFSLSTIEEVYIEDVHSIGGASAKANFSFGRNVEKLHIIFQIKEIKINLIQPKIWQKKVGITVKGKDIKKNVADLCLKLYPNCNIWGKRGALLDGRSDSLMIAH